MRGASWSVRWILAIAIAVVAMGVVAAQGPQGAGREPRGAGKGRENKSSLTQEQIANVQERIAIAIALVDQNQEEAQRQGLSMQGWRQATLDSLLSLPVARLRNLQDVRGVESLTAAAAEATAAAQADADSGLIGNTTQDLTYKPISPCRYIDTRNVGGMINGFRGYDLFLAGNTYGGVAACAPLTLLGMADENDIGALAMNVTVYDTSFGAPGFVAVKPTTGAPTSSLVNWYEAGATVQAANQAIVTTDQSGAASEFYIQTSNAVHVIVDLFGAFIAPQATALSCTHVTSAERVVAVNTWTAVDAICPTGYSPTGGGFQTPEGSLGYPGMWHVMEPLPTGWRVWWDNQTNGTRRVTTIVQCCRVPGR